jgi:hypothetical protein
VHQFPLTESRKIPDHTYFVVRAGVETRQFFRNHYYSRTPFHQRPFSPLPDPPRCGADQRWDPVLLRYVLGIWLMDVPYDRPAICDFYHRAKEFWLVHMVNVGVNTRSQFRDPRPVQQSLSSI